ncbi:MAG TPA: respiratory nitrate reductase subunit gamma [Thermoanaerobaculia bacterium]|jgi:nitrate reductase gamma subunit|nr:respiratory nitrate reductase subunit gamma [Thermoanaerobaculia bacterium]
MNDLLFALCPYIALALLVTVPFARIASPAVRRRTLPAALRDWRGLYRGSPAWRLGIGLVLVGHLLGLTLPNQRVLWRFLPGGPMTLQAAAFGLGLLALAGCASLVRERFRPAGFSQATLLGSAVDSLFLTLLALGIGSGLVMTFAYHLGSAWYAVTLAPYLRSLVRLAPDVALVADLPPVVKLHLLSAIAMVAVLPFTALGLVLVWPLVVLRRPAAGLVARRADAAS